jgi:hypothetical protein
VRQRREAQRGADADADAEAHGDALAMLALFALGCLSSEERRSVDRHLASGCSRCKGALQRYLRVAAALGAVIAGVQPSMLGDRRIKRHVRQTAHAT